jgi:hypothetical protein
MSILSGATGTIRPMAQWLRHGNKPHVLTLADRSVGGRRRAEKIRARKLEERAREEDRKAQADPTYQRWTKAELIAIAHFRREPQEEEPEPAEPWRRLSVAEQDAAMRGLTGPCWVGRPRGARGPPRGPPPSKVPGRLGPAVC